MYLGSDMVMLVVMVAIVQPVVVMVGMAVMVLIIVVLVIVVILVVVVVVVMVMVVVIVAIQYNSSLGPLPKEEHEVNNEFSYSEDLPRSPLMPAEQSLQRLEKNPPVKEPTKETGSQRQMGHRYERRPNPAPSQKLCDLVCSY